jgi:hypothetical protein
MSDKQLLDEIVANISHYWKVNERRKKLLEQKLIVQQQYLLQNKFDYSRRRRSLRNYADHCTVELGLKLAEGVEEFNPPSVSSSRLSRSASAVPPKGAHYLLDLFLAKADREVMPGDLEEEFTTSVLPNYGPRRAQLWFWTKTMSAIVRRNPVCRWLLVCGLGQVVALIFRKISS